MSGEGGDVLGEAERNRRTAVVLMRMALALLDRAEETLAAAHLQGALDALVPEAGTDVDETRRRPV